jgi:cutinase
VVTTRATAAACADVDIAFARGTGEAPGLGITGGPFVSSLTAALAGRSVSSYAVAYAAPADQSGAGPGGTDLSKHVATVAAACPRTRFVLGGYSQGASVVDVALGIIGGGTPVPANLSSRVAAVVVFGNPLGLSGRTIASASPVYGSRSKDYCNTGDPVCGAGSNVLAHLQYGSNGMTAAGATFAAALVARGTSGAPPAAAPSAQPTTPRVTAPPSVVPSVPPSPAAPSVTPTLTSPPATPPRATPRPSASGTCVRATTKQHLSARRAIRFLRLTFANGTNTYIGPVSSTYVVSLRQVSSTTWKPVTRC